ncbi:MAG TPA: response regulator transcription factor [Dehalococcoidia bacterium]|nr:response regulator transcription factor [Dehalococcoidia bacterium]
MKTEDKLRVMIAEDHAVVRSGLRSVINGQDDMEVVAEAEDGVSAVEKAKEIQPDVILMDITMPGLGGLEATRQVKNALPRVKIVILTIHASEEFLFHALKVGADGYLTKSVHEMEVVAAIRAVSKDRVYIDPGVTRPLVSAFVETSQQVGNGDGYSELTDREKEMLPLIAGGRTNKEIAQALQLSEHTVHNHRAHLMEKLGMHDRSQLLLYAIRHGIISP